MKQRPVVISVIAGLLLLNGVITLATGYRLGAPIVVMLFGAAALVLSAGMWKMWAWAWIGTVLLQVAAIGFALYEWYTGGIIDFLAMILGAIVLLYLFRAETRALFFGEESPSTESAS